MGVCWPGVVKQEGADTEGERPALVKLEPGQKMTSPKLHQNVKKYSKKNDPSRPAKQSGSLPGWPLPLAWVEVATGGWGHTLGHPGWRSTGDSSYGS